MRRKAGNLLSDFGAVGGGEGEADDVDGEQVVLLEQRRRRVPGFGFTVSDFPFLSWGVEFHVSGFEARGSGLPGAAV
eukprot:257990-Rhodomonas_salina.5